MRLNFNENLNIKICDILINSNFFKKVDGKLLCYLCNQSHKRALAKAKKITSDSRRAKKRPVEETSKSSNPSKSGNQNASNNGSSGNDYKKSRSDNSKFLPAIPEKIAKTANNGMMDPSSSDHVVAMTQLKETIASLNKKLTMKDSQLLQKDKEVGDLSKVVLD